ncbi:hypothetical protein F9288_13235 [Sphingomonas sp. CL5.1]|nr:hypothetical protein [Sphingomonas sp. CL5.1]QKS00474.1 hypothetical protein F9288_13235 [Sphingomonas sp. CL5.1]
MNFINKTANTTNIRRKARIFPPLSRRDPSSSKPCQRAIARATVLEVLG